VPAASSLVVSPHAQLPDESLIVQSVVADALTVTVPVGVEPANSGDTVTNICSTCSFP